MVELQLEEKGDEQQRRRRDMATFLCKRAQNGCAWQMADRLAKSWELGGCSALGIDIPAESDVAGWRHWQKSA